MKKYSMKEVEKAVGGVLISGDGNSIVTSISKDSREAKERNLFFPIIGETHDGHNFISQAIDRGCKDFIFSSQEWGDKLRKISGVSAVLVDDTTRALGRLAGDYLDKMDIRVIGITGSTGKTSTKDLTRFVCASSYETGCTEGNLNNHIGLPLTILSFAENTQVGILEMGMDKPGEMDYLAKIARPHIALMTNIGISHIENIGSREGIFRCKMEITNYFDKGDTLIVSQGEDFFQRSVMEAETDNQYLLQICGEGDDCDFQLSEVVSLGEDGTRFTLEYGGSRQEFSLPIPGAHNARNASLAVAAGVALGIPMKKAAEALKDANLTQGRIAVKKAGGITVIDDTYNASPDSMKAAMDLLVSMEGKRKIAVLGDMYELGKETETFHRQVGEYARKLGIDCLYGVGEIAENIVEGFGPRGKYYLKKSEFIKDGEDRISHGDVVLFKGSRGMAMEELVMSIIAKRSK